MKTLYYLKREKLLAFVVGALLLVASYSCRGVQPAATPTQMATESSPRVTLAPGDGIDIKFFFTPELNESQTVRPDGKITLQLVGDVQAQGKTPEELRDDLLKLYSSRLAQPEIAVIVRSLGSYRVYVGGEVKTPGIIVMPYKMTALDAIMQAGGFNMEKAEIRNVVIIRNKDNKLSGCALDFKDALKGKEVQPFYLEPQDIVYVPQTRIVKIDQWIDQNINKIVPQYGMYYTLPLGSGRGTIGIDQSGR
jgi:protein involved in polysaccharide export with SLBB domain